MLLLHISDIHFRSPDCLTPGLDPDRPYRTRMVRDVRDRVVNLGPVDAILVGGDIAFKGAAEEYVVAYGWLEELATACGCSMERVFVVPGNHDVDRSVILRWPSVQNAQAAIRAAQRHERERTLRTQFTDAETSRALLLPLAAYNEFAKRFSCQVYSPDRLYWTQNLPLENGVHLRVHGLTSTLLSGANGGNDQRGSLYLSPLQTVFDPVDDVVNLVLCHHPPDWLMDQDDVHDAMCGRAAIHMLGHKHRQRITRDPEYMRFSAGAVNPERDELGWEPGYNLVDIRVVGQGNDRMLKIDAHVLHWQGNPELYQPKLTHLKEQVFRHQVRIPARMLLAADLVPEVPIVAAVHTEAPDTEVDVEVTMSDTTTRNLVFRFWNLTGSQRREIALYLGLIDAQELQLPEPERYGRALQRAGERHLLNQVAQEVKQRENK
jgi:hypothetical protein